MILKEKKIGIDPNKLLDIEFWNEAWLNADGKREDISSNNNGDKWKKLWDKQSKRYSMSFESLLDERRKLVDFFFEQNIILKGDSIFDIGCGTGSFAIPLLEKKCKVIALDSSDKMLDEMEQWLVKLNLLKPECINQRFQDYESDKKCDIVLAAFTPAVKNSELLFKMEKFAEKYCILVASYDSNLFAVRHKLCELVFNKPHPSISNIAFFPFSVLYTSGRMPNMKVYETEEDKQNPLTDQIEYYIHYFKTLGKDDNETKEIVTKYFTEMSKDGIVHNRFKKRTAVIWWSKFNSD